MVSPDGSGEGEVWKEEGKRYGGRKGGGMEGGREEVYSLLSGSL